MKQKLKNTVVRLLILLVGLVIAHLGVTMFLLADLGADPFNVLVQGIFRTIKGLTHLEALTHGYTHMGIFFLIIIVLLFVDRTYIRIGTIVCMFFGGPIIDMFTVLLQGFINSGNPFWVRIITVALGCIILAFGMTIVMESNAGVGPNDLVAISISDKLHTPFGLTRTITDIAFILMGFLLGGVFGIGTIICACLVGIVAERFLPFQRKWINRFLNHEASKR